MKHTTKQQLKESIGEFLLGAAICFVMFGLFAVMFLLELGAHS